VLALVRIAIIAFRLLRGRDISLSNSEKRTYFQNSHHRFFVERCCS